jgi:hypothetical protein
MSDRIATNSRRMDDGVDDGAGTIRRRRLQANRGRMPWENMGMDFHHLHPHPLLH